MLKLATKFAPTEEAFRRAVDAGFGYAEIWTDADVLAGWQRVAALARHFPLEYALHFPNRTDLDDAALDHCAALCEALECATVVIHQPMFDACGAELLRRAPKLQLAVENHARQLADLDRWAADGRYLTLDVEHVWMLNYPRHTLAEFLPVIDSLIERLADKLRHVHLPGYVPGYAEHRPMYCARELVFPVLSKLFDVGFNGLVVSEAEPEYQTLNDLRMDVLLFDAWQQQRRAARVAVA